MKNEIFAKVENKQVKVAILRPIFDGKMAGIHSDVGGTVVNCAQQHTQS